MKILVAPLNWGLGHASRCVPLVHRFLEQGHEVILGGDGESLALLRKHFPKLRYVYLAPLNLRYSKRRSQVGAMLCAFPKIIAWSIKDHAILKTVLREEHIDQIISDNRFGLYTNDKSECVYMTHQLHIMLPRGWKWLEPLAARLHARIYTRYNKVWVPDFEDPEKSLAGELSHPKSKIKKTKLIAPLRQRNLKSQIEYIGPLSRFPKEIPSSPNTPKYDVVAVLSGLEPQRTMLEQEIITRYTSPSLQGGEGVGPVLIVQGLINRPNTRIKRGKLTMVPYMNDAELTAALMGTKHIIARSGYSTIMDLHALGLLEKAELFPTPGQPEQEYLACYIAQKTQKNAK